MTEAIYSGMCLHLSFPSAVLSGFIPQHFFQCRICQAHQRRAPSKGVQNISCAAGRGSPGSKLTLNQAPATRDRDSFFLSVPARVLLVTLMASACVTQLLLTSHCGHGDTSALSGSAWVRGPFAELDMAPIPQLSVVVLDTKQTTTDVQCNI